MSYRWGRFAACALALCSAVLIGSSAVHAASGQAPAGEAGAAQQYPRLPQGQGRDTLIRVCGKCHSPTNVIANGQTREGWESEITKMAGLGAQASDEEFTEILEYVSKNFPPATEKVNVNKATAADLESQLGLSTKQAADVVAYREKNGPYKTLGDLAKVPGMMATEVEARKNKISFE